MANTQQRLLDVALIPKDAAWARRLFEDLNATLQANQRNVPTLPVFLDFTFRTDSGGVPTTPLRILGAYSKLWVAAWRRQDTGWGSPPATAPQLGATRIVGNTTEIQAFYGLETDASYTLTLAAL